MDNITLLKAELKILFREVSKFVEERAQWEYEVQQLRKEYSELFDFLKNNIRKKTGWNSGYNYGVDLKRLVDQIVSFEKLGLMFLLDDKDFISECRSAEIKDGQLLQIIATHNRAFHAKGSLEEKKKAATWLIKTLEYEMA